MKAIDVDLGEYIILEDKQSEGILYAVKNEVWDKVLDYRASENKIEDENYFLVDCCELYFDLNSDAYSLSSKIVKIDSSFLGGVLIQLN
jgi:hypothetical protein